VILVAVCLAQFMVILDVAIVNVALPTIRSGLGFSATGLQWVVNAYTLTFAGFLMLGGRAADLLGRKRVLLTGTAAFALCSLVCAAASSRGLLLGARALQGLAGAVVSPATLSIITSSVPEGAARNRAMGAWAAIGGLGASSGALLGGILTQAFGWPAIFAVNVPLGAIVVALGWRVIPAHQPSDENAKRHFDLAGAVLVTAALASITFGIVQTDSLGWGSAGVIGPLLAGVALLGGFLVVEGHTAEVPLVPLSMFRIRPLRLANLAIVLLYVALFSMWYFLTLFIQVVRHDDALQAGFSFVPMTLMVFTGSSLAPGLIRRFGGPRGVLATGMLFAAVGLTLLSGLAPGGSYIADLLPGGMLAAFGMGLSLVPATITATQGVERARAGVASGLLNTSRLMGGALGLAVLGTLAQSATRSARGHLGVAASLTYGYQVAFTVGAVVCLVGVGVALRLPRRLAVATNAATAKAAAGPATADAEILAEAA
jgi:EmrB/QacA subfamily drug resistance transporter